ncbi:MAG: hypothetical protein OXM02_04315 [Bacteroidota bacterium]|nr:hypothetical protein [Bacteroidota bacterium]
MSLTRIHQELTRAQQYFDYVEGYPTPAGGVMVKFAVETSRRVYILEASFPDAYPYAVPSVYVRRPVLQPSPHRYDDARICFIHPRMWNPGRHDLTFVIKKTAKWLAKYEVYQVTRNWPGVSIEHW